jgi:hypothetical protein
MVERRTVNKIPQDGLIEQIMPEERGLANVSPSFRQGVLCFLDCVSAPADARWPFFENTRGLGSINIETTAWALVCLQHVGAADRIAALRTRVAGAIDRFYNRELGLYQETDNQERGVTGRWRLHNDSVCRNALAIVGVEPRLFPRGIEHLRKFPWAAQPGEDLQAWLERCWAAGPRIGAKEIFQYLRLYSQLVGMDDHVRQGLEFLESKRDPQTGFIGAGKGVELGWAMRGHRNLALGLLWPLGVAEPMLDQMIDSTLECQRADGLFDDGSMCANMDAVHLLAEYGLRTEDRRKDIVTAIRRCVAAIFDELSATGGGFRFELDEPDDAARLTNGTAFVLYTLRYWQAIDPEARRDGEGSLVYRLQAEAARVEAD